MTAQQIVRQLDLQPHPEGGFYKEVYRSEGTIAANALPLSFGGKRNFSTSIYYLLQQGDYSGFHRIKSDEGWHFYAGGTLLIHCLSEEQGLSMFTAWKQFRRRRAVSTRCSCRRLVCVGTRTGNGFDVGRLHGSTGF